MPYIPQYRRDEIDANLLAFEEYLSDANIGLGDLNYVISELCMDFLASRALNYTNINTVIGVLECVKLELYRMVASPYEDKKLKENGPLPSYMYLEDRKERKDK